MKAKLLPLLALLGLTVAILGISPFASAQTDISPAPSPLAQPTQSPEMQGMEKMSNSVTKNVRDVHGDDGEGKGNDAVDHWHFGNIRTATFCRTASPRRT
jgi:hypothetical protein